jgi:hypothetical protein
MIVLMGLLLRFNPILIYPQHEFASHAPLPSLRGAQRRGNPDVLPGAACWCLRLMQASWIRGKPGMTPVLGLMAVLYMMAFRLDCRATLAPRRDLGSGSALAEGIPDLFHHGISSFTVSTPCETARLWDRRPRERPHPAAAPRPPASRLFPRL